MSTAQDGSGETKARRGIRWWPAIGVMAIALGVAVWVRMDPAKTFQQRNLTTLSTGLIALPLLLIW